MKNIINYLFITASFLLLFACKKEEVPMYSGINAIYFNNTTDYSNITFAYDLPGKKDSTITIRAYTMGPVSDVDREFNLVILDTPYTTAQKEINYVVPDRFVIKAGKAYVDIPFKLLRTAELTKKTYVITMILQPNDNFTIDYQWDWISLSKKTWRQLMTYTILFDDIFSQPKNWQVAYYGTFSRKKLYAISDFFEIEIAKWNIQGSGGIAATVWPVMGKVYQRYLNDEAAKGNIILDEDGTPMKMGSNSQ